MKDKIEKEIEERVAFKLKDILSHIKKLLINENNVL